MVLYKYDDDCDVNDDVVVFIVYYDILNVVSISFLNTSVMYRRRIKFFMKCQKEKRGCRKREKPRKGCRNKYRL